MNPSLLSTLESYLKLTTTREKAISANMANVDTPGYRTRDINFESELKQAISRPAMQTTERPDGNDVSLDREGLLMAETQLQFQLGIQLVKNEFHLMLSAINGGS
jgi:flagellar basal-body rod protein FlgB